MENDLVGKISQLEATELRQIVLGLCLDPKNKEAVTEHIKLLAKEGEKKSTEPQPTRPSSGSGQAAASFHSQGPEQPKKRARRTSAVNVTPYTRRKCENCDSWFAAIDNADEACKFHPGMFKSDLHVSSSYLTCTATGTTILDAAALIWNTLDDGSEPADWDDKIGRELFPHGFRWTCCGLNGPDCSPCVAQYHVARPKDTYTI
ncbi:hypothetical protein PG993_004216 [Apiospora rasikravindrae]|uniref:Uncharacterized protein n=1 Tax=Apiospora rasikravindrae TaxID=990691 RepID=A0ABR1TC53_9PEZI